MRESPTPGDALYNSDGELVGHVDHIDANVIKIIPTGEGEETAGSEAARGYGKADLVWRCGQCGEVGELDSMPDRCPSCDAPREELYYLTQD